MARGAVLAAITVVAATSASPAELKPETVAAWEAYVAFTEARIASELASADGFLVMDFLEPAERSACRERVDAGNVCVLRQETLDDEGRSIPVPSGMVHHWYGSVLVPGVSIDRVLEFVQAYDESAARYPEVEDSRLLAQNGGLFEIFLRLRRKKVMTVHYNTEHEVEYWNHGKDRASSRSVAKRIREIANPGESNETEKSFGDDHGFLWGLNSYWRFAETPDGTIVECESISLSRNVPAAARWLVKSYIDSVPRESLESTLAPIRTHLAQ